MKNLGHSMIRDHTDKEGALWGQPARLVQLFSIGRTTVWKLTKEMQAIPKYRDSFLDLGYQLKLVKLADFEQFLKERSRSKAYLRKPAT